MSWCYHPATASPSALEAQVWIWASTSLPAAHTRGAMSSGSLTRAPALSAPCAPVTSPTLPSGMMSPPLTGSHSEGPLTQFSRVTPASHFRKPDNARAKMMSATSGLTLPASSGKLDPHGSFSKMLSATLPSAQRPSCESYGKWASRLRLASLQRLKQARRTSASDGSAWPTARTMRGSYTRDKGKAGSERLTLEGLAIAWPTPTSRDFKGVSGTGRQARRDHPTDTLHNAVAQWPTPAAHEARLGVQNRSAGSKGTQLSLSTIADRFNHPPRPMPTHGPLSFEMRRALHQLLASAGLFKHPKRCLPAYSKRTRKPAENPHRQKYLQARSWDRWHSRRQKYWHSKQLNPLFVEWLMGWPSGHSLSSCSATGFTRWRQRMRSALYSMPTAAGAWIWEPPVQVNEHKQMELF